MESILIGKIANIHGIKGELKIYPYTDDMENLTALKTIYLDDKLTKKYKVQKIRIHKEMLITKLEGVNDADLALTFKSKDIYIPRESLKELDVDTYYIEDLLNMEVIDIDTNEKIGKLEYVFNTGANDVYEIKKEDESKIYLPAIKQVIKKIDLTQKKIYVKLMEGLI